MTSRSETLSAADKRRVTLANKKLDEQAALRKQEASGKPKRTHKPTTKAEEMRNIQIKKQARATNSKSSSKKRPASPTVTSAAKKSKGNASRRPPPAIHSDEEHEMDSGADNAKSAAPVKKAVKSNVAGYEYDGENDEDEDEDEDEDAKGDDDDDDDDEEGDDDLQSLGAKDLKVKLQAERLQWANDDEDDDPTEDHREMPSGEMDMTTSSEVDVRDGFGIDDDDDDNMVVQHKGNSKRALARLGEAAVWKSGDNDSDADDVNLKNTLHVWPKEARYVEPQPGSRVIQISKQPNPIAKVLRAGIRLALGDVVFWNVYLGDAGTSVKSYYNGALKKCADNMNMPAIVNRLNNDSTFSNALGRVLAGRVSLLRSNIKDITSNMVQTAYNLGPDCGAKVAKLQQNVTYIFPTQNDGALVRRTKPFHHPAIRAALQQVFGKGFADKHGERFTSSIAGGPRSTEDEMPIAITAFVATCYHASLDEYRNGSLSAIKFNADTYEDVSHGHVKTLEAVREKNPDGFHRLMADLFVDVMQNTSVRTSNVSDGAMAVLDLGGMDV